MEIMNILRGILGVVVLLGCCYLLSSDRKKVDWKLVGWGIGLQFLLAVMMIKVPYVNVLFDYVAGFFIQILNFTEAGANFVFGSWPDTLEGTSVTTNEAGEEIRKNYTIGYVFAFKVLPTIVFFAAFSAVLFYLGVLQRIIYGFAWVMSKTMRLSGAESIAAAANVFIGQTEAPLVIKPYLDKMTKSEILCLMVGGMATIAGGVFAAFVGFLGPEFALHFLTASIISAPAAIVAAKILFPEQTPEKINRNLEVPKEKLGSNILDAIAIGTKDGIKLAVNVGAMLLVFIAMVALVNYILADVIGASTGLNTWVASITDGQYNSFSLELIFGVLFSPFAWIIGVPMDDIFYVGQLLGKKTVINEFVAYADLKEMRENAGIVLSDRSVLIATYALCGFANFASIGIQIGGISAIAPAQRETLTSLGIKALIGGTVACFLTAAIAGMLV